MERSLGVVESPSSSPIAQRTFCGECGTPIALIYDGGDEIALHAGTLDDTERFPPAYHYGVERKLSWVDCGCELSEKATEEPETTRICIPPTC